MTSKKSAAPRYAKAQLLRFERYRHRRDLLSALLDERRTYTCQDVDKRILTFLKGEA